MEESPEQEKYSIVFTMKKSGLERALKDGRAVNHPEHGLLYFDGENYHKLKIEEDEYQH